jgi:signal transduction histidine kinase
VDVEEMRLPTCATVDRNFRHVAEAKNLPTSASAPADDLPRSMDTRPKRLQQILKNLLSNAFKFTHQGHVKCDGREVVTGWSPTTRS